MRNRKGKTGDDLTIERGRGATYSNDDWTVYAHGTYERSSVLAGQHRRTFVDSFATLAAAQAAYPTATVIPGSTYAPPFLNHLPDEDEDGEGDEYYSREGDD